jgi:hypothetical protein
MALQGLFEQFLSRPSPIKCYLINVFSFSPAEKKWYPPYSFAEKWVTPRFLQGPTADMDSGLFRQKKDALGAHARTRCINYTKTVHNFCRGLFNERALQLSL